MGLRWTYISGDKMELDIDVLIKVVDDLSATLKENGDNISSQEILLKIGEIENILQAYEALEESCDCRCQIDPIIRERIDEEREELFYIERLEEMNARPGVRR